MRDILVWTAVVTAALVGLYVVYQLVFGSRAYYASLAVTAVMLPGLAGFTTCVLYFVGPRGRTTGGTGAAEGTRTPGRNADGEGAAAQADGSATAGAGGRDDGALSWPINADGPRSFLWGSAIALALWFGVALIFKRFGRADGANPTEYARLCSEHRQLSARLGEIPKDASRAAADRARSALESTCASLRPGDSASEGMKWASQSGYVVARAELEAAETALIEYATPAELGALAAHERRRVDGSRIAGSAALLETLQKVEDELADEAKPDAKKLDADEAKRDAKRLESLRTRVASVKETVDEYRDARRYALVSARSNLYGTILLAGTLAYLLLGLALLGGADARHVLAGVVFYLVGAVIGLFRQLASAGAADTQVQEDYGLDDARLIQRPLFSGIAAVGGAALMTFGVVLGSNNVVTGEAAGTTPLRPTAPPAPTAPTATTTIAPTAPTATTRTTNRPTATTTAPAATAPGASPTMPTTPASGRGTTPTNPTTPTTTTPPQRAKPRPRLSEIFDLDRNELGILYAAIFGLTPGLLITRLRNAEQFKGDLRSTEPGERG